VAGLCVPYLSTGFGLSVLLTKIDRTVYPESEFPLGQLDYQNYYLHNFDSFEKELEEDVLFSVRCLFRAGDAGNKGKPALTAGVTKRGGLLVDLRRLSGGSIPRDDRVISEEDERAYVESLSRNGFYGPGSYYMNHERNLGDFMKGRKDEGRLKMPVLFLHGAYDYVRDSGEWRDG